MDQVLSREHLGLVRDEAVRRNVDFAEIRYTAVEHSALMLQDGRADRVGRGRRAGIGLRVLLGGAWGFATTESPERDDWVVALGDAIDMAKVSQVRLHEPVILSHAPPVVDDVRGPFDIDPAGVSLEQKLSAVQGYEEASAHRAGEAVANLMTGYNDARQIEMVCNTQGTFVTSESVRSLLWHMITVQNGSIRQQSREVRARQCGFELIEETVADEFSVKAAERAVSLLSAAPAPAGRLPALFHPSITGLLVHEALGHNTEADLVLAGQSILNGKLGTKIGADCITVVDDTTIPGSWGSYAYDSEGVPGGRRVLVENGILKGFLHSVETATKMGTPPNGSARADGFSHRPIVRMSNTMILPGESSLEDLIADIDVGILLQAGQWGHVWCEKGQYTCHAGEGMMIRDGQLAEQVRDVAVSGMVLETLANALGVSRDFELEMPGHCGKNGQRAPVNGGGPYVKVSEIVVGGQA